MLVRRSQTVKARAAYSSGHHSGTGQSDRHGVEITLDAVQKQYGNTKALNPVTLTIARGELLAIVGPSGCGKSTLLSLIAGLEAVSSGEVKIAGEPLTGPYQEVGIVFQRDGLLEWNTILNNVLFYPRMSHSVTPESTRHAVELLELTGLKDFANAYPRQLSGGMRQRAALCRALLHVPPLLLLDEPFAALDALTRERLNLELAQMVYKAKATTVFITHSIQEAVFLADRVVVMSGRPGRILRDIEIDLPRPRGLEFFNSGKSVEICSAIRALFESVGVL